MSIDHIVLAFFIASRLTGMILTMPVLGLSMFPRLVKGFMLLGLTGVILPTVRYDLGYLTFGECIVHGIMQGIM